MRSERVTVSLPEDVRRASQRIANKLGLSFSAVVAGVTGWLRARPVDAWLAEHHAEHGAFNEDELRALVAEAGVPYLPPRLLRSGDGAGRSTSGLACRPATCGNTPCGHLVKIEYWSWRVSRAAATRTCWSASHAPG